MKFDTALLAILAYTLPAFAANHFAGLTVSNSVGGAPSYVCRTQDQWNKVFADAKANGFRSVLINGFDCDALTRASTAAASNGMTILAGIYYQGSTAANGAAIDRDVQSFRNVYAKFGSGRFVGLTVGNEVNDTPLNIMSKVNSVRSSLRSAGINTPVSTMHTWVQIRDNPVLCSGDFVAANAEVYFDGGYAAEQAGDFIFKLVVPSLKRACPGKKVIITEAGFPSRGAANRAAVPSVANERSALLRLNCASRDDTSVSVYAHEYDDQLWKGNDVERSFGIIPKIQLNGDVLAPC